MTYTCDELIPDLCKLNEEVGQVEVKGIPVTYFKFTATANEGENLLPIVAIHGGPSFAHNYILPLKQQACRGRTIIFYDQAGCGKSRPAATFNVTDYPWLLDPLYYATVELPVVIEHALVDEWRQDQQENVHIIGSSWGTMLSQLYALEAKDETRNGLASMVLSGPLSDSQTYIKAQWDQNDGSLGSLPPFIQKRIHALEQDHAFDLDEYKAITDILTGFFTVRTQPAPDCFIDTLNQANMEIYTAMQGPSEFGMSGVLANFNVTGRLHEIDVPVLLSHGKYDTMRPSVVEKMKEVLPRAETLFLSKSGHCSMIDEPGLMNSGVSDFFDRVETPFIGLLGLSRGQPTQRQQLHTLSSPFTASFSMMALSTLLALFMGFFLGMYQEKCRRGNRLQYITISDDS